MYLNSNIVPKLKNFSCDLTYVSDDGVPSYKPPVSPASSYLGELQVVFVRGRVQGSHTQRTEKSVCALAEIMKNLAMEYRCFVHATGAPALH